MGSSCKAHDVWGSSQLAVGVLKAVDGSRQQGFWLQKLRLFVECWRPPTCESLRKYERAVPHAYSLDGVREYILHRGQSTSMKKGFWKPLLGFSPSSFVGFLHEKSKFSPPWSMFSVVPCHFGSTLHLYPPKGAKLDQSRLRAQESYQFGDFTRGVFSKFTR